MSRPVKFVSLLVALLLVGGLVAGIAVWTRNNDPNNPDPGLYVKGKLVKDPGTILTVGEHDVDIDEYRYYFLYWKSLYEAYFGNGDAAYWDDDVDGWKISQLMEQTESDLQWTYGWLAVAAQEGIVLAEEDLAELEAEVDELVEAQGASLDLWLAQNNFKDMDAYRIIRETEMLAGKAASEMNERMYADNRNDLLDGVITAKHILLQPSEDIEDADEAAADLLARAEAVLDEIRESEDPAATFDRLMNELSTDTGLANFPDGYTFTDGAMVEEFYNAANALQVGEISGLVESTFGYHIIMRVELDEEYVEENAANSNAMIPLVYEKWVAITQELEGRLKELAPIRPGEYYDQITAQGIR